MDRSDVILQNLKTKKREYNELEDDYRLKKATLTEAYNEMYERRKRLSRIVDEEASKMNAFLHHVQQMYQDAEDFYRGLHQLMEESQIAYQHRNESLQQREEILDKNYWKQRNDLENDIDKLRRLYVSTTK